MGSHPFGILTIGFSTLLTGPLETWFCPEAADTASTICRGILSIGMWFGSNYDLGPKKEKKFSQTCWNLFLRTCSSVFFIYSWISMKVFYWNVEVKQSTPRPCISVGRASFKAASRWNSTDWRGFDSRETPTFLISRRGIGVRNICQWKNYPRYLCCRIRTRFGVIKK